MSEKKKPYKAPDELPNGLPDSFVTPKQVNEFVVHTVEEIEKLVFHKLRDIHGSIRYQLFGRVILHLFSTFFRVTLQAGEGTLKDMESK